MPITAVSHILKDRGLRDTQSRRLILAALQHSKKPLSPTALQKKIASKGNAINTVTVYRVIAMLEDQGIIHRHPCNGMYSLCTLPDEDGHHGFLHCTSCGKVEEFTSKKLSKVETKIARSMKFTPQAHVSEIVGSCHSCQ